VQYERSLLSDDASSVNAMLCTNDTASDEQWTLMTVVHGHRSDDQLQRAAADDAVDYQFICQSRLVIAASPSDDRPQHT